MSHRTINELLWPRLNQAPKEPLISPVHAGQGVPRILHQTYPTRDLPAPLHAAVEQTRAANRHWDYRLYDDAEIVHYIRSEFGEVILAAYLRIDPMYGAARADLFRYLLMYRTGGVYLDIKSVATRALDNVLRPDDTYILSQWHGARFAGMGIGVHAALRGIEGTEYQQWHIVAAPGHPFLKSVIENVLRNLLIYNPGIHGVGKDGVLAVTGPIAYTMAIHPLLTSHPHRFVDSAEDLGFDYNHFMTARNSSAHTFLFRSHYAALRQPIAAVGPMSRAYGLPFRAGRKLARLARRSNWNTGMLMRRLMRSIGRRVLPAPLVSAWRAYRVARLSTEQVFTRIYSQNEWGGKPGEYHSGSGSSQASVTEPYVSGILRGLATLDAGSLRMIDLGCGDFQIGQQLAAACASYVGVDIVRPLIEYNRAKFGTERISFIHANMIDDSLPRGDVCLLRQVLQHLSNAQILAVLPKLDQYRWCFITEHHPSSSRLRVANLDKIHGRDVRVTQGSGVFLDQTPFSVPKDRYRWLFEVPGAVDLGNGDAGVIRTYLLTGAMRNE